MTVLIITHSEDNESVSMVRQAIERKGGEAIRFDTDRYPTEVRLSAYYGKAGDERLMLTNDEGEFNLREVTAIWHRRLNYGAQLPRTLDRQLRNASLGETRAAAQGMLASLKAFRVDALPHIRHAENKQLQLTGGARARVGNPAHVDDERPVCRKGLRRELREWDGD